MRVERNELRRNPFNTPLVSPFCVLHSVVREVPYTDTVLCYLLVVVLDPNPCCAAVRYLPYPSCSRKILDTYLTISG